MPYLGSSPARGLVGSADIDDNAITLAKMAGGTDGNLITYDASGDPAVVAAGTSGHFLKSQGAGSVPVFAAASGSFTNIASGTLTNSSDALEFEDLTHDVHILHLWQCELSAAATIEMHFSTDNGSSYLSGQYDHYFTRQWAKTNGVYNEYGNDNVKVKLVGPTDPQSNGSTGSMMATITFDRNADGAHIPYGHAQLAWEPAGYAPAVGNLGFKVPGAAAADVDAFKLVLSTGQWDKLSYRLLGFTI